MQHYIGIVHFLIKI